MSKPKLGHAEFHPYHEDHGNALVQVEILKNRVRELEEERETLKSDNQFLMGELRVLKQKLFGRA